MNTDRPNTRAINYIMGATSPVHVPKHKTPYRQHPNGLWYALPLRQDRKDLTPSERTRVETAYRPARPNVSPGLRRGSPMLAALVFGTLMTHDLRRW